MYTIKEITMAKKKLKMSPYIIRMTIDEQIPKLTDFIGNS